MALGQYASSLDDTFTFYPQVDIYFPTYLHVVLIKKELRELSMRKRIHLKHKNATTMLGRLG